VVSMSKQEFSRLDVLLRVQSGRLRVGDACVLIGPSAQHPAHARRENAPRLGAPRCRDGGARRHHHKAVRDSLTPSGSRCLIENHSGIAYQLIIADPLTRGR
jgi:hypothetical protein